MSAPGDDHVAGEGLPALLTVEEAARVLRIGRTLAYQLARRYRATDGADGLPVIELGSVLRVPRAKLEELAGGPIAEPMPAPVVELDAHRGAPEPVARTCKPTRRPPRTAQAALPFTAPDAS